MTTQRYLDEVRRMVKQAVETLATMPFPADAVPADARSGMPAVQLDRVKDRNELWEMLRWAEVEVRPTRPTPKQIDHAMWVLEAVVCARIERPHRLAMLWRCTEVWGKPRSWRSVGTKVGCNKDTARVWEEAAVARLGAHLLGTERNEVERVFSSGKIRGRR